MLKAGIIGLPNVGKSTLFNALIRSHKAPAENYPFCTIEPNLGVVAVPELRLEQIARIAGVGRLIPATVEFVDIAGLVKGAARGEGLGNKFLSHIREVDALVHVVRCFEDPDIVHVTGSPDPVRDIEIVATELALADLEAVRRRREKITKEIKQAEKHAVTESHILDRLEAHLNTGQPAATLHLAKEEWAIARNCFLLSSRPTLFVANVKESDLAMVDTNPLVTAVRNYARTHQGGETVVVCAQLESDLIDLTPEEAAAYLRELGVAEPGGATLIHHTYRLLGLRTFFTSTTRRLAPGRSTAATLLRAPPERFTPILSAASSRRKRWVARTWSRRVPSPTPVKPAITGSKDVIMRFGTATCCCSGSARRPDWSDRPAVRGPGPGQ